MANQIVFDTEDYAQISGVVTWSGGMALLKRGERCFNIGLIEERPDLFGRYPELPERPPLPRCAMCKEDFEPSGNNGAPQRYCGRKCRKAQENKLKSASRIVARHMSGQLPGPPRPDDGVKAFDRFLAETESRIDMVGTLMEALGVSPYGGARPALDPEVQIHTGDNASLLADARRCLIRLQEDRTRTRGDSASASQRDTEKRHAQEVYDRQLQQREMDRERTGARTRFFAALGDEEDGQ